MSTPPPPGDSGESLGTPVSVLTGDRLCTTCGYNLTGQPVIRETRYELLVVRCPECGSVTDVLEYPLLGRWAPRLAAAFAAMVLAMLLGLLVPTTAALAGFSVGTAEAAGERYASYLRDRYQAESIPAPASAATPTAAPVTGAAGSQGTPGAPAALVVPTVAGTQVVDTTALAATIQTLSGATATKPKPTMSFQEWWEDQDHAALMVEAADAGYAVEWRALFFWFPLTLVAFALGCLWSVALIGQHRRGLFVWGVVLILIAGVFVAITCIAWRFDTVSYWWQASRRHIGTLIAFMSLAYATLPLMFGLMVGRSVARAALTAILPPRLRSALSVLWLADGKPPPGSRPHHV